MRNVRMLLTAVAVGGVVVLSLGCASTTVRKDPGPHDRGIRYYRPKPYLKVMPVYEQNSGRALPDAVTVNLEYLPDFSEEYSIHVRAGVGVNKTKISLEDGWNLTAIDMDIDSKFNENVTAVGNLIKGLIPGGGGAPTPSGLRPSGAGAVVQASNVPLGYYEAVVTEGPDSKKRLYGWRYVGFLPFANCPVDGAGAECFNCQSGAIYGLVFHDNIMVFRQLNEIAATTPQRGTTTGADPTSKGDGGKSDTSTLELVTKAVRASLKSYFRTKGEVITDDDVAVAFVGAMSKYAVEVQFVEQAFARVSAIPMVTTEASAVATKAVQEQFGNGTQFSAVVTLKQKN